MENLATKSAPSYIRYSDDVEVIEADEQQTIDKIIEAMRKGAALTYAKYGKPLRTSHAKAHALLHGELRIAPGLPAYLAQGIFAAPRTYPVIVRLAQVPGDLDDDRKVSTPRGMAIKIFDVSGEMLPSHENYNTQDFVLDTGKIFNAIGLKSFLAQISGVENLAPRLPQTVKGAVSTISRAGNALVGDSSSGLDFFGHPFLHPLGESYFSQVPFRYGDYVAKLNATPASPAIRELRGQKLEPQDYDGLRTAMIEFFQETPAEFEIGVQLCTDLEAMPVENPNKEWPESQSPYQTVAKLVLPVQDAYSAENQRSIDRQASFSPGHSLAAHRPLGSINRARIQAYEILGRERLRQSQLPGKLQNDAS